MGVTSIMKSLSDFATENSLRYDYKYLDFITHNTDSYYTYKDLFEIVELEQIDLNDLENFLYSEIGNVTKLGDVEPVELNFSKRDEETESLYKKIEKGDIIKPLAGDILISKIRPYLNKNVLIGNEDIYFTKAFIQIRPKIDSLILYTLLRSIFFKNLNSVSRLGKGYPTLKENDLKTIRFSKSIINKILRTKEFIFPKIELLYNEIANLKNSKVKEIDIINKVIGTELDFNWEEFERLKSIKKFDGSITDYSNNIDCRFSYKFHNKAGEYLSNFLLSKTDKKIKHYISEPIVLGKGVSPSDYDDEGDYFYIGMSNIKTWYFVPEDCKKVKDSYSSANQNKTITKNDIILARSGEGTIGKVALIENEEILGIFADFTQRIRLENYNPQLAYYYFRSDLFQYLVYTHKKGLGNNTNIFPNQIQEFPIPEWKENKQIELVENIKSQIDSQNAIDIKIAEKQNEISKLIEDVINNS